MRNVPSLYLCWPAAVWNTNTNTNTYKYKDKNTNNIVHKSYSHPRAWELCPPLFCSSSNTNSIVWPHFVNNLHLLFFFQKLWQIHATPGSVVHCGVQGFQKWYSWPWLLSLLKNEIVLSLRKQMCTSLTQSFFAEKVATVKDNCCFSLFLLLPCLQTS